MFHKRRLNNLKPKLEAFIDHFKYIYKVDDHVHLMEMIYDTFIKKWTPYNQLLAYI